MKRSLLFLVSGLLAGLVSCQKEDLPALNSVSASSLTVTIPQGIETRAMSDYGNGSKINRCILEIYRNGVKYGDRKVVSVSGNTVTFSDLQLVNSQTYNFVLWADCGDGTAENNDKIYNTEDLSNIHVNGNYSGNNDEFDAFFGSKSITVNGTISEAITLNRPFGQLNVKTTDLRNIDPNHTDLQPTHVKVSFSAIPTSFTYPPPRAL